MEEKKKWSEFLLNYALYFILGIMILCVIIADPSFLSINNMWKILAQASTRGILALGVAGMIVLAGTDLSAGRILGCGAAVSASLLQSVSYASRMYKGITEPLPLWVPLILSIVVCVVFCLVNGFGVAKLHMHAFIISLGTQLIAYGILCLYIDSQEGGAQPLASLDSRYIDLVNGRAESGLVPDYLLDCYVDCMEQDNAGQKYVCYRRQYRGGGGFRRKRGEKYHAGLSGSGRALRHCGLP